MLSDHFWGVNSDFCANFINQNSFCDIKENTPKSYGMGLSPPPYGKSPQFCDFFASMASLTIMIRLKFVSDSKPQKCIFPTSGRKPLSQQPSSKCYFITARQRRQMESFACPYVVSNYSHGYPPFGESSL